MDKARKNVLFLSTFQFLPWCLTNYRNLESFLLLFWTKCVDNGDDDDNFTSFKGNKKVFQLLELVFSLE